MGAAGMRSRFTLGSLSETNFAAPRAESVGPFRSWEPTMIGEASPDLHSLMGGRFAVF